jgi:hypothetical protein
MPSLADMPEAPLIKMMYAGVSGTGKTGSLVSLAQAGYRLWVLDMDKEGIQVLRNVCLFDPKTKLARPGGQQLLSRIQYQALTDKIRPINGIPTVTGSPEAFKSIGKHLADWNGDKSVPPIDKWTDRDILVLDSLTGTGDSAMRYTQLKAGRLNQRPYLEDWGQAIAYLEQLVEMLTDPYIPCHVIIITHVKYVGGGGADPGGGAENDDMGEVGLPIKGFPNALGKQLPATIGRFFNTIVLADTVGEGAAQRRKIFTTPRNRVDLKTVNPAKTKSEYELDSGLAALFADLRNGFSPKDVPEVPLVGVPQAPILKPTAAVATVPNN